MQTAFPEAMVEDFKLIGSAQFGLPDPGDEHVIAAAVKTQAQALVTENGVTSRFVRQTTISRT